MEEYQFTGVIYRWPSNPAMHLMDVPPDISDDLDATGQHGGWGSVRVEVQAGTITWRTSVFPDSGRQCFVLPIKAAVRKANGVAEGDELTVCLHPVLD
ncbi:DUF1905 domain-containing protein [Aestuariimicrobium ganziense]|uniref:DUF1905 domain-containing protein n=1 Tax=Aestuariimicrobium ganziense TaxID=2773677 RepID=UPI0019416B82|nr:DUF1905 domain-containing protein [Aestuariimicrobium ganziense]